MSKRIATTAMILASAMALAGCAKTETPAPAEAPAAAPAEAPAAAPAAADPAAPATADGSKASEGGGEHLTAPQTAPQ